MNLRTWLFLLSSFVLLAGCNVKDPIDKKVSNIKEEISSIREEVPNPKEETPNTKEETFCQNLPHISLFPHYKYGGKSESAFNREGYAHIKPVSYTGYAHHTKKVIEQYEINDLGIRFRILQSHGECKDEVRAGYMPLVYNKRLQSTFIVTPVSEFYIKKIVTTPRETSPEIICSRIDDGIKAIRYTNKDAVIETMEGSIFVIGDSLSPEGDGRSMAKYLCDNSEGFDYGFIPHSLEFTHQKK